MATMIKSHTRQTDTIAKTAMKRAWKTMKKEQPRGDKAEVTH